MKILIISSCTGEKKFTVPNCLTQKDFEKSSLFLKKREQELNKYVIPAEYMYEGMQHKRLMQGINYMRRNSNNIEIDLYILSAGYGLIKGNKPIAPYECTFSNMKKSEITAWADHIHIPKDIRNLLCNHYELVILALGDKYLEACKFDKNFIFQNRTIVFCSNSNINRLPNANNIIKIPLGNNEASKYKCGLIGLKGELTSRLLMKINEQGLNVIDSIFEQKK